MPRKKKTPSTSSSRVPGDDRPEYVPGWHYDPDRPARVIRFLEGCVTMSTGRQWAGKPMRLMEWQKHDILEPFFGWVDDEGLRRYRRAAIYISKKNGKSSLMAGLVLYFLLADMEPGALVCGAAVDRLQAGLIYRAVASAVRSSRRLSEVLEVIDSRSTILHKGSGSRYMCLAADSYRSEGLDASAVIIDELHAHKKPDLVEALIYSGAARQQPAVIAISTAGSDRNGIGYQWYQDALMVEKDPAINPTFFGKVYEAAPDDDLAAESTWRKANPSLGSTIALKDFANDFKDAQTNARKMTAFMRYRLNIWVEGENSWFDADKVAACKLPPLAPLAGRPCWCGIDIASHLDITAAAFLFKDGEGGYEADMLFWVPQETIGERERVDGIPYSTWIRNGWLRTTQGARLDHRQVAADIIEYGQAHSLLGINCDPWHLEALATYLQDAGYAVSKIPQTTAQLNLPSKLLEGLIAEGKFRYTNPVLQWMLNNASVWSDATEAIKPDKKTSREKIDGVVACINGLALAHSAVDSWEVVTV